jgi:hypothetical protein
MNRTARQGRWDAGAGECQTVASKIITAHGHGRFGKLAGSASLLSPLNLSMPIRLHRYKRSVGLRASLLSEINFLIEFMFSIGNYMRMG